MKVVNFYLGPAFGLASRTLTVTRMYRAGDDTPPVASYGPTDVGAATEAVGVELPSNTIYEATLVDVVAGAGGETSVTDVLPFHTGALQFPGPRSGDRLQILSMEDISSSSSSMTSSSSSQSSSSSSSSSSVTSSSSASSSSKSSSSQSSSSSSSSSSKSSSSQSSSSSESVTSSSSSQSSSSASSTSSFSSSSQ